MNVKLLDCTLRDGGYLNDWRFTQGRAVSILNRLINSKVDYVEIGFLDERRPFDIERTIMPDTASTKKIFGNINKKNTKIVAMIDYGTLDISKIEEKKDTIIDAIRVIFKKKNSKKALEFCKQIKEKGYEVFAQLVSITDYTKEELIETCGYINEFKPDCVSIVDTYGLLYPNDLHNLVKLIDESIDKNITLGFHAHNNLQLAFANAFEFLNIDLNRNKIIDATLYGMGKSAGNCPIELISNVMNEKFNCHYNINQMLEAIDETVLNFYKITPWGYKVFFYLTSKNKCHPNHLTNLIEKNNFSISKLDDTLSCLDNDYDRLYYKKEKSDSVYNDYLSKILDDDKTIESLKNELSNKKILLLGPGETVVSEKEKIDVFINNNNPYIISINYLPKIKTNMVFITNKIRYSGLALDFYNGRFNDIKILALSNIEENFKKIDFVVNRYKLIDENAEFSDNSFIMLLKLLIELGINEVFTAGFDGYKNDRNNFVDNSMEYSFIKEKGAYFNDYVKKFLSKNSNKIRVNFLTYSEYNVGDDISLASM